MNFGQRCVVHSGSPFHLVTLYMACNVYKIATHLIEQQRGYQTKVQTLASTEPTKYSQLNGAPPEYGAVRVMKLTLYQLALIASTRDKDMI